MIDVKLLPGLTTTMLPLVGASIERVIELDWYDGITEGLFQLKCRDDVTRWFFSEEVAVGFVDVNFCDGYRAWPFESRDAPFSPERYSPDRIEAGLDVPTIHQLLTACDWRAPCFIAVNRDYTRVVASFFGTFPATLSPKATLTRLFPEAAITEG